MWDTRAYGRKGRCRKSRRGGEKVGSDQSGRVIKDLSGKTKGKGNERKP